MKRAAMVSLKIIRLSSILFSPYLLFLIGKFLKMRRDHFNCLCIDPLVKFSAPQIFFFPSEFDSFFDTLDTQNYLF